MKHFLTTILCLLVATVTFTSCEDKNEPYAGHEIVGNWENTSFESDPDDPSRYETFHRVLTFYPDGNYHSVFTTQFSNLPQEITTHDGSFTVTGNKITMTYRKNDREVTETNNYIIRGTQMRISNENNDKEFLIYDRK